MLDGERIWGSSSQRTGARQFVRVVDGPCETKLVVAAWSVQTPGTSMGFKNHSAWFGTSCPACRAAHEHWGHESGEGKRAAAELNASEPLQGIR